jgi:NAD(P)-dependent dehydrogenase (short-subunit alcohol dehydrogenase family)
LSKNKRIKRTAWQRAAEEELLRIAFSFRDEFTLRQRPNLHESGYLRVPVRLKTGHLPHEAGGLLLKAEEDFVLWIGGLTSPPLVEVEHNRFVGFPHVMNGRILCIYLDIAREWNPNLGIGQAVDRLHDWLRDASANKFDPESSLYHAVGGSLNYGSSGLPMIVVRDSCPTRSFVQSGFCTFRSDHRWDLQFERTEDEQIQVPVLALSTPLPLGIGDTFIEVLARLDDPLGQSWLGKSVKTTPQTPAFLTALAAVASKMQDGSPQLFILMVPHPAGGPPHLLAGILGPEVADMLRKQVRRRGTRLIDVTIETFEPSTPVEWCLVSDERASVTTRRDSTRPISALHGKNVHVWGCGGLGSWIAEFVARAGAKRIVLCDPGVITGGLLVRQNFEELDIGRGKAQALQGRIKSIHDDIEVEAHSGNVPSGVDFSQVDVVIDATISQMIGQTLDRLATVEGRPLMAQVATDVKTGTLGIISISAPGVPAGANEVDRQTGRTVLKEGQLEPFHTFWSDVQEQDELVPTRGCSLPTFHGSAADMAALAASLTSLLGSHIEADAPISGTHLISLPHSPAGPMHKFVQFN